MFQPMDHENGLWSSPSNREHTMAQGGETSSHRKERDMTVWNWDSVAFVAQSASGMATDMASGGTQIYSVDDNEEYHRVPELTLQLDGLSGDHVQPLLGEGLNESELRCRSFCRSQSPSLSLKSCLTRDDTAPEELESLSLMLGGSSYPILEEDGISSHGAKRFCTSSPQSQFPMCQVDNCEADLSEAKDYLRRHKVCEMHSKAVKAAVRGLMQRFCRQCSRFHPLAEFDEGKCSCRRRLKGHNLRGRVAHLSLETQYHPYRLAAAASPEASALLLQSGGQLSTTPGHALGSHPLVHERAGPVPLTLASPSSPDPVRMQTCPSQRQFGHSSSLHAPSVSPPMHDKPAVPLELVPKSTDSYWARPVAEQPMQNSELSAVQENQVPPAPLMQSPSASLKSCLTRDDMAPEELESLSLMLGGSSYPILVEDGISSHGAKRFCTSSPQSQFPMCQVDNCEADLSEAKDYLRRHKVCEMHSKAVKAAVRGLMQRFCRQCSRFHPLAEFDEGKCSCRRRLKGHNWRRRVADLSIETQYHPYRLALFKKAVLASLENRKTLSWNQLIPNLDHIAAGLVKILEDPSEQQKLLPSTGINETLQNRLLELERASILIVGRKDIQGDFVEFQFLSPESMARVVGVGLQWSRVVVTRQFNVIVTYVGNKAWLNFWKETRQNKDSKMFTLLRGTIPRVSTKLEAVSNLTAKESSRRFGVGLEEFKSEIHNLYVKDNTKQNGMLPLIFELAKQMGVSGENARNSGKQHSGASSSGYAGGKSDDKRPANPKGKTQIPGDGNLEDKEGEESEFPSSNPSKLPAEPPLDTKKNKSLTVTVIPESGGTFHQRSTNDLAYPEGPVQHATIVPWLQFKFEMLGDYDDRRITTTTTTQCNLGGGEPKYPDLDCGYCHDNITISLNCEKQKAARLKSATVDATNSSKRTISTTFTGSRSSANQISGQFGGTFQIPIVDIGVQAQGNVSRIGTVGDSDSLANSNETLNNLLGGFYVNPAELEGNLIYNFLHPEDIGELLLKNRKQFLHSGTCRTFWPTIIGEWDTLDMDETCMYSFKTERDITSVKDLIRSNVARNIPYYMRQRYQVPFYVNHAMTHIHCYETTTLEGAGEKRLEHVLIKYPAF